MADYTICDGGVIRESDGAWIPDDEENRDWRAYLEWLGEGNEPDPCVEPEPPEADPIKESAVSKIVASGLLTEEEARVVVGA